MLEALPDANALIAAHDEAHADHRRESRLQSDARQAIQAAPRHDGQSRPSPRRDCLVAAGLATRNDRIIFATYSHRCNGKKSKAKLKGWLALFPGTVGK